MASTYIQYAKGGTDYRTKGTISCWVKRSSIGVQQDIWSWGENNSSDAYLRFDTADNIEIHCDGAGNTFNTTSLHRDVNGWYHFVFSLDGSNATANLRRRFWINGIQQDEGSGRNDIAAFSGAVMGWHSVQDLWIGARARSQQGGDIEYFDGLISHFHYCSNHSYAASDFGETDATTGEWKIKTSPNVQYGSEGFFLKMEDSSNMDLDSSSNSKTLTTSGTLTATKDNPSNVFATLNPLIYESRDNTFSNGNNTITGGGSNAWNNKYGISTIAASSGKYYVETKVVTKVVAHAVIGLISTSKSLSGSLKDNGVFALEAEGRITGGGSNIQTGLTAFSNGDIAGLAFDATNGTAQFYRNGSTYGNALSSIASDTYYFATTSYETGAVVNFNFGNGYFGTTAVSTNSGNGYAGAEGKSIFNYQPPTGYSALSTRGLNE